MKNLLTITLLSLPLFLSACQGIKTDASAPEVPGISSAFSQDGKIKVDRWWESFKDPELNKLMDDAFVGSFTLTEAAARLEQMEAIRKITGSGSNMSADASVGGSRTRTRTGGDSTSHSGKTGYNMGFTLRYEIDIWGKLKARETAADLDVAASGEDLKAAAMMLAGQIGDRWIRLKSVYLGQELVQKQIATADKTLKLIELRFRNSRANALDVLQQKQNIEGLEAQLPLLDRQVIVLKNELAVLLGKAPGTKLVVSKSKFPELTELPEMGLPAGLLAARPDISSAGYRLQGARWLETAARADRLPSLTLSPSLMYNSERLGNIFENWVGSLAGSLAGPVVDGGRRDAEIDRLKAVQKERLFSYRRIVMNAIREVEDALVQEETQKQHLEALEKQHQTSVKALSQAELRYRKGQGDYLPVIAQIASSQRLEQELIRQRTELFKFRISLYRALGGDWLNNIAMDLKGKKGEGK